MIEATQQNVSRRNFIKGVIAAGAACSSAAYTALMKGAENMRRA